ncbi:hypothetical protein WDU94_008046 [Cyamophila willieti]
MLSEKEKQEYAILFNETDHSSLIQSIDKLKKNVAIVSVSYQHIGNLVKEHVRQNEVHAQAMFENMMNVITASNTVCDEIEWNSDGDSIDSCLDSEEDLESEEMEM